MRFPFEVPFSEIEADLDNFVEAIFSSLESEFLTMPRGTGFIDYPVFEKGYEVLKKRTSSFTDFDCTRVSDAVFQTPISIIVLRTMLGFTPSEWAYATTQRTGVDVSQGFARSLDRNIRLSPLASLRNHGVRASRVRALVETACNLLLEGAPLVDQNQIHRLDKADTKLGASSIRASAEMGVPYAMLLYERFLGRPFAGHRDSVSELVGDILESATEDILTKAGISYRKTKRAERIEGFDQAPDFIVPSEYSPQLVIEAKITEDDGTARDKITRVQHLYELSIAGRTPDDPRYEVVAAIAGRGFGVRRGDMKKLLLATRGKVFTLRNLDRLVDCTRLKQFKTR